ncbi:MAG: hypothetical protein Fur007_11340 [Rhodoferax sp.]
MSSAWADGPMQPPPKVVVQECSSCHIAYWPNFLPTSSWKQVLSQLDKHYGTDASLPDDALRAVSDAILSQSQEAGEAPPNNRFTRSFWFTRKHGPRHVSPDVWQRASVKSPTNCTACHLQAEQGNFDEHAIRIPR